MSIDNNKLENLEQTHVLGIETSCDDTGVAIINLKGKLLSNCIDSQLKQHLPNGGVIPVYARELHAANIDNVAKQAFVQSKLPSVANNIHAISVTNRPGLQHSLAVGLYYAKSLATKYTLPLIPIHHMQAHALMPLNVYRKIRFPFLTLLISGGHSLLAIAERYNKYHLLGNSTDIALGELLDKVARRLRLRDLGPPFDSISGGSSIELLASRPNSDMFKYFDSTSGASSKSNCNFNFSGYNSYIDRHYIKHIDDMWSESSRELLIDELSHFCSSLQRAVAIQIARRVHRALVYYENYWRWQNKSAYESNNGKHLDMFDILDIDNHKIDIVVSGGCSSNKFFIDALQTYCKGIDSSYNIYTPPKELCSDNGAMIAWNGVLKLIDYRQNNNTNRSEWQSLDEQVLTSRSSIDELNFEPVSGIGEDLRFNVKNQQIKLPRLKDCLNF